MGSGPLISVDPGLRACGVAAWRDQRLVWAGLVKNQSVSGTSWSSMVHEVESAAAIKSGCLPAQLVIEQPQVYNRAYWKGDPDDLIQLAGLVGAFVYFFDARDGSVIYKPAAWKGSVTKEITEMRAKKRLSAEELVAVELPAKSLRSNVWDAVGIGLHYLKR